MNTLDRFYLGAKLRFADFVNQFKRDERGVSSIVATVLLILVVVLLAAIFWEYISEWFENTWSKIMGEADKIG